MTSALLMLNACPALHHSRTTHIRRLVVCQVKRKELNSHTNRVPARNKLATRTYWKTELSAERIRASRTLTSPKTVEPVPEIGYITTRVAPLTRLRSGKTKFPSLFLLFGSF